MSAPPACKILHVAGWNSCGFYQRTTSVLSSIAVLFPTKLKVIEHNFADRPAYRAWLIDDDGFRNHVKDSRAHSHSSSPFVWLGSKSDEESETPSPQHVETFVGGHDDTMAWARSFLTPTTDTDATVGVDMVDDAHSTTHEYDYDLIVIGGGSGGMAASKEAAQLGAKVACLDYVKPSPQGTTWGLGGTCVNVGCIPKKLMHTAALLKESMQQDAQVFGITTTDTVPSKIDWSVVRENIQNYIRGLNFKYRVALREKEVTYLNKLGTFKDAHTLEVTDKKGRTSELTASRFLIATGGRPTPLDCPGGELAISSDDVFSLEKDPGKTLCVGASYISLECAGFLAGYGNDVTVAVRSILLRGFDRECVERVGKYMEDHGVKFKNKVTPTSLEKVEATGKIKVTFSDGSTDEFDTVLAAVGRMADTNSLGLDKVNVKTNTKNGKIVCTNEQSSTPNIYAVGDVMEGCPELTPVAIQAGQLLARRLFSNSTEPMDYVNVCTTVFTPLEYACVGLSEDDCIEQYGEKNIEVYVREFVPLEWSLSHGRAEHNAFTKVIVEKTDEETVLGIHYCGPNAGEVMQGYGAAIKGGGLSFKTLKETVGIHPTSSEEIVSLSITKSSGEDAAAGGC